MVDGWFWRSGESGPRKRHVYFSGEFSFRGYRIHEVVLVIFYHSKLGSQRKSRFEEWNFLKLWCSLLRGENVSEAAFIQIAECKKMVRDFFVWTKTELCVFG